MPATTITLLLWHLPTFRYRQDKQRNGSIIPLGLRGTCHDMAIYKWGALEVRKLYM